MPANAIDLTTVALVNAWLNQTVGTDAANIQNLVTAYSALVATYTSRRNLAAIGTYSETYNGTGSDRQQLRNYPILSVASLSIGTTAIMQSPGQTQTG